MTEISDADLPEYAVLLRRCGEAMYGTTWQTELARELTRKRGEKGPPVDAATVRRWARGAYKPGPWAWLMIASLLRERAKAQQALFADLTHPSRWYAITGMRTPEEVVEDSKG